MNRPDTLLEFMANDEGTKIGFLSLALLSGQLLLALATSLFGTIIWLPTMIVINVVVVIGFLVFYMPYQLFKFYKKKPPEIS
ncbi:MAG: hypothetical protein CL705_01640 [Chloroflexi bacterium]|nr:hypothetical protein [Chloroflexota bacterium]|tara:strand:- start:184 stop:429 length:246 start_codon:yes stop_codon:yes gene_type:complete